MILEVLSYIITMLAICVVIAAVMAVGAIMVINVVAVMYYAMVLIGSYLFRRTGKMRERVKIWIEKFCTVLVSPTVWVLDRLDKR